MLMLLFRLFSDYFANPAHLAALQADFDPTRMGGGGGENIPNHSLCELSAGLILLEYDQDHAARFDICAGGSIHRINYMRRIWSVGQEHPSRGIRR